MRKTTLVIDDETLGKAREALGTRGIKDTIDAALNEVIVLRARRALARRIQAVDGLDLTDEVMRQAWRG
ncbi:MAG: hypothetical protein ACR2M4_12500 [Actinomycetota bacterium]